MNTQRVEDRLLRVPNQRSVPMQATGTPGQALVHQPRERKCDAPTAAAARGSTTPFATGAGSRCASAVQRR
jgi:hypothetical protein